ncbi:helix-turn-helix transcriptional regulator [Pseudomonas sp. JS425]|uniref:helix-turn-helix domain-containing protein n=1 Tax=Pseudomonas sp. JS425 TaxID=2829498 RepID=UPI00201274DA|nr:helix-turn-helix transcriptional regulator [Pseudomonas sp. JS425]
MRQGVVTHQELAQRSFGRFVQHFCQQAAQAPAFGGQQAAAKRMGIPQPKVSGMMRGDFTNLSERKLMDCLNRLGYDIEIKVRPAAEPIGHLTLATA